MFLHQFALALPFGRSSHWNAGDRAQTAALPSVIALAWTWLRPRRLPPRLTSTRSNAAIGCTRPHGCRCRAAYWHLAGHRAFSHRKRQAQTRHALPHGRGGYSHPVPAFRSVMISRLHGCAGQSAHASAYSIEGRLSPATFSRSGLRLSSCPVAQTWHRASARLSALQSEHQAERSSRRSIAAHLFRSCDL